MLCIVNLWTVISFRTREHCGISIVLLFTSKNYALVDAKRTYNQWSKARPYAHLNANLNPSTSAKPVMNTSKFVDSNSRHRYVSLRSRVQNAVPAQPCVGKFRISLVLLNFLHCHFRLCFKTPYAFESYPCHTSEMIRNTLNHCLKFALRSIFCHICYGKISEKNVNTFIKVKLFIFKTSDSCFQGFDFFQMLLASHR